MIKPYYSEPNIKIFLSDCLEVMKELPNKSIDVILTDIPYGEVSRPSQGLRNLDKGNADIFNINLQTLLDEFYRITKSSIHIFCGHGQISEICNYFENHNLTTRMLIWEKTNPSPMNGKVIYLSGIEKCIYGKFSGGIFNAHCRNTVFRYPTVKKKRHPTEKSLDLFKELIEISSNEQDLILDPFLGSGTTCRAAKDLGRKCIGIEINEEYVKIAIQRLGQEVLNFND